MVVIVLRASKYVLPTGINLSTLKTYHAAQEVKEHFFKGSLINEYHRRVVEASTLHVVLDVLCVKMYLRTIKTLGGVIVF